MLFISMNGRGVEDDGCHAHDHFTILRHSIRVCVKQMQDISVIVCILNVRRLLHLRSVAILSKAFSASVGNMRIEGYILNRRHSVNSAH